MFLSNLTELTLSHGYRRFFKVVPALTAELRAENYRIRHEVYRRGYEPLRPEGVEADACDDQSVHCLVQSVSSGQFVGCARLVLVDPDAPPPAHLPFEISCEKTLDRSIVEQIGGEVAHREIRIPSMMSVREIIGGMNFVVRALFKVVSREVQDGLQAAGEQAVLTKHHPFCQ